MQPVLCSSSNFFGINSICCPCGTVIFQTQDLSVAYFCGQPGERKTPDGVK